MSYQAYLKACLFVVIAVITTAADSRSTSRVVRVVLVEGGFAPFYFPEKSPESGIYKDVLSRIAKESGLRFEYVYVPQRRKYKMFEDRMVDVEPGVSPEIRKQWANISVYTSEFMRIADVVLSHENLAEISDLKGKTIGCIGGYKYPWLEDLFAGSSARRDDSPDELTTLKKLKKGRIDATVMYQSVASFLFKRNPELTVPIRFELDSRALMFRIHTDKIKIRDEIDKALKKIPGNEIEEIIARYR